MWRHSTQPSPQRTRELLAALDRHLDAERVDLRRRQVALDARSAGRSLRTRRCATHAAQHAREQEALDAELDQARDRAGGVARVHGREHQVAGERRLHRHLRGLGVADLADHDDVGVLAQDRAQRGREGDVDLALHLHLAEARVDHLDRVLDGR